MVGKPVAQTRRSILRFSWRSLAAVGAVGCLPKLLTASAQNRVLVVIYLFGGNDSNNMLVPLNGGQYAGYARTRGDMALKADALIPVNAATSKTSYGFHPSMGALAHLYNQGVVAMISNVGATVRPATHSYESLSFFRQGHTIPSWAGGAQASLNSVLGFDTGVALLPLDFPNPSSAPNLSPTMARAATAAFRTPFPQTGIGQALRHVAGMIEAASMMALGRQVFLASYGGFDTHWSQPERHAGLLNDLSQAMGAFYQSTVEMGVAHEVTTITDSEFGRNLVPNLTQGTDHGWGSHQLAMGATVVGGDVYGRFPDLTSTACLDSQGGLVPTTANQQFYAAVNSWLQGSSPVGPLRFMA
jgi:uncharacterized protein (DUF1501 family)